MNSVTIFTGAIGLRNAQIATSVSKWRLEPVKNVAFKEDAQNYQGMAIFDATNGNDKIEYKFYVEDSWRIDLFAPSVSDGDGNINNIRLGAENFAIFKKTTFTWDATPAHKVYFACADNAWEPISMKKNGSKFEINCYVPHAESYRFYYKFVVDDRWYYDVRLPSCADNAGNINNFIDCSKNDAKFMPKCPKNSPADRSSYGSDGIGEPSACTPEHSAPRSGVRHSRTENTVAAVSKALQVCSNERIKSFYKPPQNLKYDRDHIGHYKLLKTIDYTPRSLVKNGVDVRSSVPVVAKFIENNEVREVYSNQIVHILRSCASCENIYVLLTGQLPFPVDEIEFARPYARPTNLSNKALDILEIMLKRQLMRRATCDEIMKHEWLN